MPTAIAKHTIHRPGAKGRQDVIAPRTSFECSEKEFDELMALGAIEAGAPVSAAPAPKKAAPKKAAAKPVEAPADDGDADDDLDL